MVETAQLETLRIVGGVGTGKTERLIEHIAALTSQGADPARIVAFCATPIACRTFAARLRERIGNKADGVRVTTPRAFALDLLGTGEAIAFTGREPHLLAPFEEAFLLEDMKVCGLKPRRLKEMIRFFYRSWSELADDNPDWLLPGEETSTHDLLKANLSFMRAYVEPEVANVAVRYLRANGAAQAALACEHVVVDDYQLLSRASQTLACLTATRSLTVAGDPFACVEAYESYPYAKGLDEFLETNPQAAKETLTVCHRAQATAYAAERLMAATHTTTFEIKESPAIPTGDPNVLHAENPTDEFRHVADTVAEALAQGTAPSSIVVAVPNAVWGRNIATSLAAKGTPTEVLPCACPIRGDIRNNDACVEARIATALDLVANPHDTAAWRCWCGYGDYLVNSASFATLRAQACAEGRGLVDALTMLAAPSNAQGADGANSIVGSQRVIAAYRAGRALIERTHALQGHQLLDEIARIVTDGSLSATPAAIIELCLGTGPDTPSALARRLRERMLAPTLHDTNAVAVVPYRTVAGLSPDFLVVTGFVNGFIPCRDYFDATATPPDKQESMHARDLRGVYAMIGKAEKHLTVSCFKNIDLESAGKLKLKINRIRLQDGIRTCTIEPSKFLALVVEN